VRVTAPSFFACDVVVPALPHFFARHPELTVQLEATSRLLDLTTGEVDVALRNVRPTDPNLAFRRLGRLGMSLYASRAYLDRRGGLPSDRSLRGHDFISYDTGPYRGPGFGWLPGAAAEAHVVFAANDALALRDAAAAGLGLAVLPHCLAEHVSELSRIPEGGSGAADILVVVHAARRRLPRVRAVMRFLADLVHSAQPRLLVA